MSEEKLRECIEYYEGLIRFYDAFGKADDHRMRMERETLVYLKKLMSLLYGN